MPETDDFLFPNDPNLLPSVFGEPEPSPLNNKIKVKIISPSYPVAELAADRVLLPSVNGDIMILPNRAPIILTLRPGRLIIYNNDKKEPMNFLVSKGIAEIRRNLCPVLAWAGQEINMKSERIRERLTNTQKMLSEAKSDLERNELSELIDFFKFVLKELG